MSNVNEGWTAIGMDAAAGTPALVALEQQDISSDLMGAIDLASIPAGSSPLPGCALTLSQSTPTQFQAGSTSLANTTLGASLAGQQQQAQIESQATRGRDRDAAQGNIRIRSETTTLYLNIMAWGESGMGKTTFINNLINEKYSNWEVDYQGSAFETGGKTSLEEFKEHPETMVVRTKPFPVSDTQNVVLTIQDMPGWGDEINLVSSLRVVVKHLLERREMDLLESKKTMAMGQSQPIGAIMKHGITACLYFLPPQRAKEMDMFMVEGISSLVAVISIIAKADTHTEPELNAYRKEILEMIQRASSLTMPPSPTAVAGLAEPFNIHQFDAADLAEVFGKDKTRPTVPPFAVMGSPILAGEDGGEVPDGVIRGERLRKYGWGTALPFRREHSDFIILKQLLFGHQNWALGGLLQDSGWRANAFLGRYESLKEDMLKQKFVSNSTGSVNLLEYMEAQKAISVSKVDLSPLIDTVCSRHIGEQQQPLEERLRCEEQRNLRHQLEQANAEARASAAKLEAAQVQAQDLERAHQLLKMDMERLQAEKAATERRLSKSEARHKQAALPLLGSWPLTLVILVLSLIAGVMWAHSSSQGKVCVDI